MAYAADRVYLDADSHVMERPDFIREFADASIRDRLAPIDGGNGMTDADWAAATSRAAHPADVVADLVGLGDGLIAGPKGYDALGAFHTGERSRALDLLGFERQLVFSTFSGEQTFAPGDVELEYGAARAHNRAMAAFCGDDPRLSGVAMLPLDDPDRAVGEVEHLLELGLAAAWVPHRDCGGRSPGHDDLDPVWARLAEAELPFVLHVGGVGLQLDPVWMHTGRPVPQDWQGGGENIRGKDMLALHHGAELFCGAMVFDGVFERHRGLRGAVVELGAGWVPSWLRRLDWTAGIWKREADLAALTRRPSEIVAEHLAFTPYVYEDVGQLVDESAATLYLFSSDYPHREGSRDPIERFESFLAEHDDTTRDLFYEQNFRRIFG